MIDLRDRRSEALTSEGENEESVVGQMVGTRPHIVREVVTQF